MLVGEALGKLYVEREFGESARRRMEELVEDIEAVFLDRLRTVEWMSETTKQRAVDKFTKLRTKIGYPKHFRDYSSIEILKDDFFGNILRSNNFEIRRQLDRVGSPVDKDEWLMSPPTVNAYFNPTENEIVFPAGILQPPFFDNEMDDAVNYGAIGAVISHEITHGFDDQGRRFDGNGNLNEWWTEEDIKRFTEKAKKVVELYSSQEVFPGVHINGELTLGENIADLGGVSIAFEAFQRHKARNPSLSSEIEGMSPEQRFFISYAQIWRANVRDQEARRLITIDPHSPDRFRAIIPAMNHEAFEDVFRSYYTPDGASHISEKIKVW
jgi:predicted metalloendopeptidase